jgi:hypothetical protein
VGGCLFEFWHPSVVFFIGTSSNPRHFALYTRVTRGNLEMGMEEEAGEILSSRHSSESYWLVTAQ